MADSTVTIVGNLTRDPEIRYTAGGAAKASFGVAVSRRWQNRQTQEWEEQTSFFNVVCWREMAENVSESLGKGIARRGHRPPRAAQLGDRERREAQRGRDRGRRGRSEPALGDGRQVTRNERRGGGDFGGGGGGGGGRRRRHRPAELPAVGDRPVDRPVEPVAATRRDPPPTTTSVRSPSDGT